MKKVITIGVTLLAALAIILVISYTGKQMAANTVEPKTKRQISYPEVSFISVKPADYTAQITGYGEAKSRYELDLKSEVSGEVIALSDQFKTGNLIKLGTTLLTVDDHKYNNILNEANATLATARLNLLEEKRQGEQAKLEWKNSGLTGNPSSPLVLRKPQLEVAQAEYDKAKSALDVAQRDLDKTRIKAPFNALIASRATQLGSYLQIGDSVATLFSTDRIEVSIPLSQSKWNNFDSNLLKNGTKIPATLTSTDGYENWEAYVDRLEQHLDEDTRQRSLIVSVDNPLQQITPLYPNTYVKVAIKGKALNQLLRLPQTAISQSDEVWYLGENDTLQSADPVKVFEDHDFVYIEPFLNTAQASNEIVHVVIRPLSSYLPNMKVNPILVEDILNTTEEY